MKPGGMGAVVILWSALFNPVHGAGSTVPAGTEAHSDEVLLNAINLTPDFQPLLFTDVTFNFNTGEYDRLTRAWRYIYSHGCTSATSSFCMDR